MKLLQQLVAPMDTLPRLMYVVTLMAGLHLSSSNAASASVELSVFKSNLLESVSCLLATPQASSYFALHRAYEPPDNGGPQTSGGSGTRYQQPKSTVHV